MIDIGQPDVRGVLLVVGQGVARRRRARPQHVGVHPDAVVLDRDDAVRALVAGDDLDLTAALAGEAVPDGVLDQGLQREEWHDDVEHLGRDLKSDLQRHHRSGRVPA